MRCSIKHVHPLGMEMIKHTVKAALRVALKALEPVGQQVRFGRGLPNTPLSVHDVEVRHHGHVLVFEVVAMKHVSAGIGGDSGWMINGHPFDPQTSEASVKNGTTELWTIHADFEHPVHLHLANMQVVSRNGGPPGPFDAGWKDTVFFRDNDTIELAAEFNGRKSIFRRLVIVFMSMV